MVDGVVPPRSSAKCDTAAIERNVAFGQKIRVQGTPAVFFEDGTRVPGAMPLEQVERGLASASKKG
jgi:thiol:disulfide interchange protein DsbC